MRCTIVTTARSLGSASSSVAPTSVNRTLRPSRRDAISGLLQNRTTTSQPFLTRCRRRASTTSDARLLNIAPNDDDARQILHWWGLETWDQQMRRLRLQILPAC